MFPTLNVRGRGIEAGAESKSLDSPLIQAAAEPRRHNPPLVTWHALCPAAQREQTPLLGLSLQKIST